MFVIWPSSSSRRETYVNDEQPEDNIVVEEVGRHMSVEKPGGRKVVSQPETTCLFNDRMDLRINICIRSSSFFIPFIMRMAVFRLSYFVGGDVFVVHDIHLWQCF